MPTLEGNLTGVVIQEILELLAQKNPASTWLISDGRDEKVVYFSTGGIRMYATEGRRIARFEDYLVHRGLVSREDVELAQNSAQDNRRESLDEALDRMGLLPRARYLEAIADLIYQEICDVVTWEGAIFEFYEGNPPPEIFDQEHPALFSALDVKAMAGKVREWGQEWGTIKAKLHSERLRPKLATPMEKVFENKALPEEMVQFYRLVDGQRTLRELSRVSGLKFQQVAHAVRDGLKEGHLRGTLVAEKEPTTPEEVLGDIERLEEALDKAINTILIHKRIATGYEKIGEKDRASEHYQSVGDLHAGAGRIASALENFRRAITLSPQNIGAHESLIRRLQDAGQEDRALEEIVGLARKLLTFGLPQRALDCLRAVKSKVLHLFDIRMLFAEILTMLGRGQEAVAEYLGIIRDKKAAGAQDGVDDLYRRILALDPQNRDARAGLSRERRRLAGKGLVWVHRASAAAAALLFLAWVVSELGSRGSWWWSRSGVRQAIAQGAVQEGFQTVRSIAMRFPASLLAASLVTEEEKLFRQAFYRVEDDLARATRLQKEGKIQEAQALFHRVADSKLVDTQAKRAKQGLRDIDSLKSEGEELRRTSELYLDARLYEDAFAVCRKVIERNPESIQGLQMPFFIRSDPTAAEVKVNGIVWGSTPLWVVLSIGSNVQVLVEKPGYQPQAVQGFAGRASPVVTVSLKRN